MHVTRKDEDYLSRGIVVICKKLLERFEPPEKNRGRLYGLNMSVECCFKRRSTKSLE